MSTPLIEIKNLSTGYDNRTVLRNVNLTVYDRDFLGIIGPNGGGKMYSTPRLNLDFCHLL